MPLIKAWNLSRGELAPVFPAGIIGVAPGALDFADRGRCGELLSAAVESPISAGDRWARSEFLT